MDPATGEIAGVFESIQPSDTDLGAKAPKDIKITGLWYGQLSCVGRHGWGRGAALLYFSACWECRPASRQSASGCTLVMHCMHNGEGWVAGSLA